MKIVFIIYLLLITNQFSADCQSKSNLNFYFIFDEGEVNDFTNVIVNIRTQNSTIKKTEVFNFSDKPIFSIIKNKSKIFKMFKINKNIIELNKLNKTTDTLIINSKYHNTILNLNSNIIYLINNKLLIKQKLNNFNDVFIDCTFNNLDSNSIQLISKEDFENNK